MNTITCASCGVTYGVSCSPWCKDGHAPVSGVAVVDDTIPGGFWQRTGTREPVFFSTHSERRAWLKAHGFVEGACHSPTGDDGVKDAHCADMSGPAPHTLATLGEWLAARMGKPEPALAPLRVDVTWHDAPGASFTVERSE